MLKIISSAMHIHKHGPSYLFTLRLNPRRINQDNCYTPNQDNVM